MTDLDISLAWGLAIAASLVVGAGAVSVLKLSGHKVAAITAFGGGVMLSAVALELVPEADRGAGTALTALGLVAGMAVYVAADAWLSRDAKLDALRRSAHAAAAGRPIEHKALDREVARGKSIAVGIFIDGVPESLALGLTIAEGELGRALLVGILIGNVVEAYGAAQPIVHAGRSARFAVALLAAIGLALALATVLGGTVLASAGDELIGAAQAVAAGAVLAVVSIAIIPYAFGEVNRWVASATVLGFVLGYVLS